MSFLWQQQEYLRQSHQLHIDSVVAVVELFDCHILHPVVPVTIVAWSGQYFLAAPQNWYHVLHHYRDLQTSPQKAENLAKLLSAPQVPYPHLP